jgi:hypothetical protein
MSIYLKFKSKNRTKLKYSTNFMLQFGLSILVEWRMSCDVTNPNNWISCLKVDWILLKSSISFKHLTNFIALIKSRRIWPCKGLMNHFILAWKSYSTYLMLNI